MTEEKRVVLAVARDSRHGGKYEFIGLFKGSYYRNRAEAVLLKYGVSDELICHECTVSALEKTAEEVAEMYALPEVPWEVGRSDFYLDIEEKYGVRNFMFDKDGHFLDSDLLDAVSEYAEGLYREFNAGCEEETLLDYIGNIRYDIIRGGKSTVNIPILHYKGVVGSRRIPSVYRDSIETAEVMKGGWRVKSDEVSDGCYDIMLFWEYTLLSVPFSVQVSNNTKG